MSCAHGPDHHVLYKGVEVCDTCPQEVVRIPCPQEESVSQSLQDKAKMLHDYVANTKQRETDERIKNFGALRLYLKADGPAGPRFRLELTSYPEGQGPFVETKGGLDYGLGFIKKKLQETRAVLKGFDPALASQVVRDQLRLAEVALAVLGG